MADKNIVSDETTELANQQKKRARRRLVGAAALALFAVIALPMIMDHDPRPVSQDIQVRIPKQDATPPAARKLAPAVEAKAVEPSPVAEVKPTVAALPAKPEAAPVAEVKPEVKLAPKVEVKPEKKLEPKTEAKSENEVERAKRALNAGATDQYVLQMGAYQDAGNVKLLQAKVKELGYASYTEKVDTPAGVRIRVRAGPFASQEAAANAQARLKKIGAGGPPGGVIAKK